MSTGSPPSRWSAWLALAGLLLIPAGAIIAVLQLEPEPRRPSSTTPARPAGTPVPAEPEVDPPRPAPPQPPSPRPDATLPEPPRPDARAPETAPAAGDQVADTVEATLRRARELATEDPQRSRELLREALEIDPHHEGALEALALKTLSDESHHTARELAQRCLEENPDNEMCQQIDEHAVKRSQKMYKSVVDVRRCLDEEPDNVLCLTAMVNYHVYEGRVDEAAEITDKVADVAPGSSFANFTEARIKAARGDYREARLLYGTVCAQGNDEACFRSKILSDEGW